MLDQPTAGKSTYFIDADSAAEMARLTKQDRFITEAMGGLFSERSDVERMRSILDLGCGPGQWVLDVAFAYPDAEVAGIDISENMVQYAGARALSQHLTNASFQVMDMTKPLDFEDNAFDLVNGRMIACIAPDQWNDILQEAKRILRPGGIFRVTECEVSTTCVATDTLFNLFYQAMSRAGLSFSPTGRVLGIIPRLNHLLRHAGYKNVQSKAYALDFSSGSPVHETISEVAFIMFELMQPFLIDVGVATQEELSELLQQMRIEMHCDDFCAVMFLSTAWGENPS